MFFSTWEKWFANPLDLTFNITSYLLPEDFPDPAPAAGYLPGCHALDCPYSAF